MERETIILVKKVRELQEQLNLLHFRMDTIERALNKLFVEIENENKKRT